MKTRYFVLSLLSSIVVVCLLGCDEASDGDADDTDDTETNSSAVNTNHGATDSETNTTDDTESNTTDDTDSNTADDTDSDTGTVLDTDSDTTVENTWGFTTSLPQSRTLQCDDPYDEFDGEWLVMDRNWLCTFEEGDVQGVLYVQAIPESCFVLMTRQAEFRIGVAELWADGNISTLTDVSYDFGGNHHNDSLTFVVDGLEYNYFHSAFDVGYHSCQNMDCANVFDSDGDLVETGCSCSSRTRPVVCVQQLEDGLFPQLIDTFGPCDMPATCYE